MFAAINKTVTLEANLGTGQTGKTVGYTLFNGDGSTFQARTTTGVTEIQAGTGIYRVRIGSGVFTTAFDGYVLWDVAGATPYASEDIYISDRLDVAVSSRADGAHYTNARGDQLDNLDATVSSRSTVAAIWAAVTDSAGVTTLLSRLTSGRATALDNLDATISSRSTVAAIWAAVTDSAGVTTLLSRLTSTRAGLLDNLDAAVSTRSTYAGTDTPGTTTLLGRIAAALTITGGKVDINDKTGFSLTAGEHTAIAADTQTGLTAQGYTTTRAGYLDTLNGLVQAIWDKATSALTTAGSIGKLLVTNIDATVSSRLATSGYTAPDNAGIATAITDLNTLLTDANTLLTRIPSDVWDELAAGHTATGTFGELIATVDISSLLTELTAIDAELAVIQTKTNLLGTGLIVYGGPVVANNRVQIVQGDDYLAIDGRELAWTSTTWPSVAGATITFDIAETLKPHVTHTYPATIPSPTNPATVEVELTATQTAALAVGTWSFALKATLADTSVVTLAAGVLVVQLLP